MAGRDANLRPSSGSFPARNTPTYFDTPYSVWDLVPASWDCPYEVERIGRMGDGGKWVCGMSQYEKNKGPFIIYSFGKLGDDPMPRVSGKCSHVA